MDTLLSEAETIVYSGTKLNIDYWLNEVFDEDQQENLHDYFSLLLSLESSVTAKGLNSPEVVPTFLAGMPIITCLLYTSDAADE